MRSSQNNLAAVVELGFVQAINRHDGVLLVWGDANC